MIQSWCNFVLLTLNCLYCCSQFKCDLCGQDPQSAESAQASPSHQQSQGTEGRRLSSVYLFHLSSPNIEWVSVYCRLLCCFVRALLRLIRHLFGVCDVCCCVKLTRVVCVFTERGAVRVRGDPNHRQHLDCHNTPSVHVCLHWSSALQGTGGISTLTVHIIRVVNVTSEM